MTHHIKEILNKIESVYFIRFYGAQKKMICTYKVLGMEKNVNKKFYIQQNYPFKLKEETLRNSQQNKT